MSSWYIERSKQNKLVKSSRGTKKFAFIESEVLYHYSKQRGSVNSRVSKLYTSFFY